MANHKSAKKRARQTITKTERNKTKKSESRTMLKSIREAISKKDKEKALELLPKTQRLFDRLTQKGVAKPKNSARKVSRLTTQVGKL